VSQDWQTPQFHKLDLEVFKQNPVYAATIAGLKESIAFNSELTYQRCSSIQRADTDTLIELARLAGIRYGLEQALLMFEVETTDDMILEAEDA